MSDKDRTGDEDEQLDHAAHDAEEAAGGDRPPELLGDDDVAKPANDDEAAQRIAVALGVDGNAGEEPPADGAELEGPQNRAARRREDAVGRRRKRKGAATAAPVEDEDLPKDKNARAKELLRRRQEQASAGTTRPIDLLPGEMVDDALSRSASATGKWVRKNFTAIQIVVIAGIAAAVGFGLYSGHSQKKAATATDSLFTGVIAERGRVMAEDKRTDEEKEVDPAKVFKTVEERTEAALAGYRKTMAEHPNTIVSTLAKLGEAGALLEKRDFDGAIAAYGVVLTSKAAGGDPDVKGRALEGAGLAKEGKGDLDGAIALFKELEVVDARGFKELGMYQQARIFLAKGDTEQAKGLLKQVHDKLEVPTAEGKPFQYLSEVVDEALRKIDPSLVPNKAPVIGGAKGNAMSADQMEKIRKMLREAGEKKGAGEPH